MGDGLEVVWCYVIEAAELPSLHSLIVDACAQANIILDDEYFCFLDRPDSMIPLSDVLEENQSYTQTSPVIECKKKEQLSVDTKPESTQEPFTFCHSQNPKGKSQSSSNKKCYVGGLVCNTTGSLSALLW